LHAAWKIENQRGCGEKNGCRRGHCGAIIGGNAARSIFKNTGEQNMAGVAGRSGRKPGSGGRPPGHPNKATRAAREAIAAFVDDNADRMQEWLDAVANGVPRCDAEGNQRYDDDGEPLWLVPPNPEKAYNMLRDVVEYHVPKLARSEMTGAGGGPIGIAALDVKGLSDAELEQMSRLMSKVAGAR
jgi:hypothetical protein